jgi:hypothetical protein
VKNEGLLSGFGKLRKELFSLSPDHNNGFIRKLGL